MGLCERVFGFLCCCLDSSSSEERAPILSDAQQRSQSFIQDADGSRPPFSGGNENENKTDLNKSSHVVILNASRPSSVVYQTPPRKGRSEYDQEPPNQNSPISPGPLSLANTPVKNLSPDSVRSGLSLANTPQSGVSSPETVQRSSRRRMFASPVSPI